MAVTALTKDTFEETVTDNDIVIIDFWGPHCGPCHAFAPVFEKASEKHDTVAFTKVNTREQPQLAAAFEIRAVPTLMVFREKVLVFRQAGALRPAMLEDLLEQVKGLDMEDVRKQIDEHDAEHDAEHTANN
jgi:thioredoxin 1